MQTINPARQLLGVMSAQDWPPKQVKFEAFYMLVLGQSPAPRSAWSPSVPIVGHEIQFVWLITGSDVQAGQVGRNRGDRYRTDMTMKEELEKALYPGFTEKLSWSVSGQSITNLQLTSVSESPKEFIRWRTPPVFVTKVDKASGVIYGSAAFRMTEMTDTILS